MALRKPFYGDHQIIGGQYTSGGEYVLLNGDEYVGAFHVLPNGRLYTGANKSPNSEEIVEKRNDLTDSVKIYNRVRNAKIGQYVSPVPFQPSPGVRDYSLGYIQRYFVQKRNNPIYTTTEIDYVQYNTINTDNLPGINGAIWNNYTFKWWISKVTPEQATVLNNRSLDLANETLYGIRMIVNNALEYYRRY
jgi:hypothetical protein